MSAPEQLPMFERPPFCPSMPSPGTLPEQALHDLAKSSELSQINWLQAGHGWRLGAAIKVLNYLGWCVESVLATPPGRKRPIAFYSLSEQAKQVIADRFGGAHG